MSALFPYPVERALEDAAHRTGRQPARVLSVLLPVWSVRVEATTTDSAPYELIDRFVARALAEARLGTAHGLAALLGLDEPLVDRTLRHLRALDHVTTTDDTHALTELGRRSLRDGEVHRRKTEEFTLHFDAFLARPLPTTHHPLLVPDAEATALPRLFSPSTPEPDLAVADRARHGLPLALEVHKRLDERQSYLPLHLVRAGGDVLAYSRLGPTPDADMTTLAASIPVVHDLFDAEDQAASPSAITEWSRTRGLTGCTMTRQPEGSWRLTLPAAAFAAGGPLPERSLGSYAVVDTTVVHLWCPDVAARDAAMFALAAEAVETRRSTHSALGALSLITHRLGITPSTPATVVEKATAAGKDDLATAISNLLARTS
ncbi:hypothetical protein [Actinokineospora bangkokensis]|uniref:Uncharacterized protein n=1 Tax=Actinokineospora bangkokensis TaxID=1193682 RepID=A0A1Q9LSZ0_9PSEU|nr:hypothetical protein [Actinokineospora bangkokensis]OLR95129.1 hypothetical protein BJP25_07445 [Actinokineospora bangkokensis]